MISHSSYQRIVMMWNVCCIQNWILTYRYWITQWWCSSLSKQNVKFIFTLSKTWNRALKIKKTQRLYDSIHKGNACRTEVYPQSYPFWDITFNDVSQCDLLVTSHIPLSWWVPIMTSWNIVFTTKRHTNTNIQIQIHVHTLIAWTFFAFGKERKLHIDFSH